METPGVFELIDDEHVLLNMGSNKIKIVNLNTMTVVHTFQGKIPHSKDPQVNVINDHQSKEWGNIQTLKHIGGSRGYGDCNTPLNFQK